MPDVRFERVEVDACCLDLHVAAGTVVALIGPSGGARRRLLLAAAGLLPPDGGRVLLDDRPVDPRRVGVVDEDHALLGGLSAAENVATRTLAPAGGPGASWDAISDLLARLALPESSFHNLAEQLSGGQQQRVALARALVGDPPLLCLDDPASELDGDTATVVWSAIAASAGGGAVVLVGLPEPDPAAPLDRVVVVG